MIASESFLKPVAACLLSHSVGLLSKVTEAETCSDHVGPRKPDPAAAWEFWLDAAGGFREATTAGRPHCGRKPAVRQSILADIFRNRYK